VRGYEVVIGADGIIKKNLFGEKVLADGGARGREDWGPGIGGRCL